MTRTTFGFDSAFLARLERLSIPNRRPVQGPTAGPRRSRRHGASVEFADYRTYTPGDDFRRVDWKAYARLDRIFLRLYQAEEIAVVTILLDHSTSMGFGIPSKALTAGRLAAIFSYVALHSYDTLALAGWGQKIDRYMSGQTGRAAIPRVWKTIAEMIDTPVPATDFSSLRSYGNLRRGAGLAIVLSDFMTDTDWRGGLRSLRATGQEVAAIQILAPDEMDPQLRGDWKLIDAETGLETEVTLSPRLLKRYQEALEQHTASINDFCRREGIAFLQLRSDVDLTEIALRDLRAAGILA
jgi:uncharacterized protein (DUF58 family)